MAASSLRRTVVFYGWEDGIEDEPFDRVTAARAIEAVPAVNWAETDGDYVSAVLVDRRGSATAATCLRYFRLRAGDDVPHLMGAARVPSQLALRQGEAVTDWTHVVWPDGFAAHDARRDAPSLTRLCRYVRTKTDERVRFFPLYDRSLVDQLEELDDVKAVDVKLQLSRAEQLEAAHPGGLFGALTQIGREADALTITTKISVGRNRNHFLSPTVRRQVVEMAGDAEEYLDNLVITGVRDTEVVYIDVLKRRLQEIISVRRSRTLGNAPDADVMYAAIDAARRDLEASNRLQRAVRLRR